MLRVSICLWTCLIDAYSEIFFQNRVHTRGLWFTCNLGPKENQFVLRVRFRYILFRIIVVNRRQKYCVDRNCNLTVISNLHNIYIPSSDYSTQHFLCLAVLKYSFILVEWADLLIRWYCWIFIIFHLTIGQHIEDHGVKFNLCNIIGSKPNI